jgi:hypothetical protein
MNDDPKRKPILKVIEGGFPDGTLAPRRPFVEHFPGWQKFPIIKPAEPKQVSDIGVFTQNWYDRYQIGGPEALEFPSYTHPYGACFLTLQLKPVRPDLPDRAAPKELQPEAMD